MRWADLVERQPRLGELGRDRLVEPGVLLVATIRRGRGVLVEDLDVTRRYAELVAATLGWQPEPGRFHLFRTEVEGVTYVRYDHETGDQHLARWPPGEEFLRRATSATSVGEREPVRGWVLDR